MGSFLSFLLGDDGEGENDLSLLDLLDQDVMDWDAIQNRLRSYPEEAAAFCHSVDPSPLTRALLKASDRQDDNEQPFPPAQVVGAFLEAYEEAVFLTDRHGTTPLLAAVQGLAALGNERNNFSADDNDSGDVQTREEEDECACVKMLLQANHQACRLPDRTGKLPIHYAVRSNNLQVVKLLIEVYPAGVEKKDGAGRLPLHYCIRSSASSEDEDERTNQNAAAQEEGGEPEQEEQATSEQLAAVSIPDPAVVKLLMEHAANLAAAGVLVKDTTPSGMSPLDLIYRTLQTVLESISSSTSKKPAAAPTSSTLDDERARRVDRLWETLTLLVATADAASAHSPEEKEVPFRIVFALLQLQPQSSCPAAVLAEALRRFPQQATERDASGRTPLMLAASTIDHFDSNKSDPAAVICALVDSNPAAARMTDMDGRLPIDFIAEKGIYNEVLFEALVKAEPRAVDTRDLKYGRHPFLAAALAGENSNVASVYHLLRAKPHVIAYYHTN